MTFSFEPGPPKEAYAFWKDKAPMSRRTFNRLAEDQRVKAFIVGGMARADMLTALHRSIDTAIAAGQSMGAWKEGIADLFEKNGWKALKPWRLDNIFRTNIQTAYNVGRYRQMMDVVEDRPYWQYSAVNDRKTRPSHRAMHGKVFRADDPVWNIWYPINGFRCRCTVSSLSQRQVDARGIKVEKDLKPGTLVEPIDPATGNKMPAIPLMPDNNFQNNPGKDYWQADLARYRADVKQLVLKDITRACPDEFCGPCEFAETDCYKRLKRHLTQEDLEDLQTVVWAEGEQVKKGFGKWAGEVLDAMTAKGELYPVGTLPARVLNALENQPRLALVTIDDKQLIHLARAAKKQRGATLTTEEIKQIPEQLQKGRWWRDKAKDNYLMTWVRSGDEWLKVVVNLDYSIGKSKKRVANHIITGGVVKEPDIVKGGMYEEI